MNEIFNASDQKRKFYLTSQESIAKAINTLVNEQRGSSKLETGEFRAQVYACLAVSQVKKVITDEELLAQFDELKQRVDQALPGWAKHA